MPPALAGHCEVVLWPGLLAGQLEAWAADGGAGCGKPLHHCLSGAQAGGASRGAPVGTP